MNALFDATDPLALGGFIIGCVLGGVIQVSRFCLVAAVANAVLVRDARQAMGWLVALAVALAGTQLLEWRGLVEVAESGYRAARLDWAGAALGGALFGIGAMLGGGCAARTLVGAAEGNLGNGIALVAFALVAWATLLGIGEPLRVALAAHTAVTLDAGDPSIAAAMGVSAPLLAAVATSLLLGAALLLWRRGQDPGVMAAGAIVGLLVVAGWWVTGVIGPERMIAARPDSVSFAGPLARAARFLGTGSFSGATFGIGLLCGTLLGASVTALVRGRFRITRPTREQAAYALVGGMLMGLGGALAGGCNIGHGLTGLAALSIKSLIVVMAIVAGMALALAWLDRRPEAQGDARPRPVAAKA
jgi:uncharacterized membrane protein YedE/YeeE